MAQAISTSNNSRQVTLLVTIPADRLELVRRALTTMLESEPEMVRCEGPITKIQELLHNEMHFVSA